MTCTFPVENGFIITISIISITPMGMCVFQGEPGGQGVQGPMGAPGQQVGMATVNNDQSPWLLAGH